MGNKAKKKENIDVAKVFIKSASEIAGRVSGELTKPLLQQNFNGEPQRASSWR